MTRKTLLTTLASTFGASLAHAQEAADAAAEAEESGLSVDSIIKSLNEQVAPWGVKIVGALLTLFIGWIIAGWLGRRVGRFAQKRFDETLGKFFANIVRYLIIIAVVLSTLGMFGIQTSSFAAIIGAAGLAIGLAFEGTLGNFASGVMLLVFRPFKVGDWVSAGGQSGTVEEIELFHTVLRALDNRKIIVPNGKVANDVIVNNQGFDVRRVDIDVGCDYGADIDETRKVLESVLPKVEAGLQDPAPQVFLKSLGASSVDWQVRVWCNTEDFFTVYQSIIRETKYALDEAGIGIPFPQTDVHLDPEVIEALKGKGG